MAKQKKVVVTTGKAPVSTRTSAPATPVNMTFGSEQFKWMGIGIVLIILGMFLMAGGSMSDPEVWDEHIIYSTRRTVIAPIVILLGLGVEIYAIFKK
jgi:hypothetical protein